MIATRELFALYVTVNSITGSINYALKIKCMNTASDKDPVIAVPKDDPSLVNDFGKIFHKYGIGYRVESPWLVVGEMDFDKKWALFLSVVPRDVKPLLEIVLPILFLYKVPFRVMQNYEYVQRMNGLWYGSYEVGKVVTIIPPDERSAVSISKELAMLTDIFKGPIVQDCLRLGAILFANFCETVLNESNEVTPFVRNYIPHKSKVPFKISKIYRVKRRKGIIGKFYVPMKVLRPNAKGDIFWGINMKKWAFTPCVIKQARSFSYYDSLGRQPKHKLMWQKSVLEDIQDDIAVPKLIDFCRKKDDYYLIMEFVEGKTLHEEVKENHAGAPWPALSNEKKRKLLFLYRSAVTIVAQLHAKGYVHRDVTDTNFVIDASGKMYILDFELTSSVIKGLPDPPHGLGTPGYVSPEQRESAKPAFQEDVYSLGALLLTVLTGKHPEEVLTGDVEEISIKINPLLNSSDITQFILQCIAFNPDERPSIDQVLSFTNTEIEKYNGIHETDSIRKEVLQKASLI
jgi:serine/threonine protein kinase